MIVYLASCNTGYLLLLFLLLPGSLFPIQRHCFAQHLRILLLLFVLLSINILNIIIILLQLSFFIPSRSSLLRTPIRFRIKCPSLGLFPFSSQQFLGYSVKVDSLRLYLLGQNPRGNVRRIVRRGGSVAPLCLSLAMTLRFLSFGRGVLLAPRAHDVPYDRIGSIGFDGIGFLVVGADAISGVDQCRLEGCQGYRGTIHRAAEGGKTVVQWYVGEFFAYGNQHSVERRGSVKRMEGRCSGSGMDALIRFGRLQSRYGIVDNVHVVKWPGP
mmetsp:Transcript_16331/g.27884  ORF Transcript_16331/g.27884 Transcript_16331/m.27884 type:complete len:270 (+) Transcript_16331:452-1261(+)